MAKKPPAAAKTPSYLQALGINQLPDLSGLPQNWSPQTTAAVQQYYAPGGAFQQSLSGAPGSEMMPTGQGGYVPNPTYVNPTAPPQTPIDYPITAPGQQNTGPPQPTPQPTPPPTPPPPPPPPQATMDWSGLASGLQGLLAPYLTGGQSAVGQNPMAQIMPMLMSKLGGYLGQLQPTQAGQQAAASQTPLDPNATQGQGQMNWGNLGNYLQNMGGQNAQSMQGNLLSQMLGYMGTLPNTSTGGNATAASTPLGIMSQNVPRYAIG